MKINAALFADWFGDRNNLPLLDKQDFMLLLGIGKRVEESLLDTGLLSISEDEKYLLLSLNYLQGELDAG